VYAAAIADGVQLLEKNPNNANMQIMYRRARLGTCACMAAGGRDGATDSL